ncbi:MAG: hypothetical protein R3245_02885 [Kiloniellales bacterium]|nr:hypothetical protein [Kiloniellales bacterium]
MLAGDGPSAMCAKLEALGIELPGGAMTFREGNSFTFVCDADRNLAEFNQNCPAPPPY